jgi:DNA polymerase III epsilon subunit-like protein
MHRITEDLIHIQMEELQKGRSFVEVMTDFLDWCGEDYLFATWGPLDLLELQRNMQYYGMEPLADGPLPFYDVQKLFSLGVIKEKTRKTLEFAIDYFQLEKDVPFHRAFSDAYYTARVFARIKDEETLKLYSYDTFHLPKTRKEELKIVFPGYEKYISRTFADRQQVMRDREVASTKCYLCHKNLKKIIKWHSPNGKHYYSAACCDVHGYIKFKIRIKKAENEEYYVIKTSKFITEEKMEKARENWRHDKEMKKKIRERKGQLPG